MTNYFYIKMEGAKQGVFTDETADKGQGSRGLGFDETVTAPRDLASGQATGKRQHSPIVITKEWGAASPQLFEALISNETLKTVQFVFYEPTGGSEIRNAKPFFTIKLTNASVSKIEKYENFNAAGHQDADDERFLEDVSFTFQKIEMVHVASNNAASDTWNSVA
ncbi:MAG: type VI secretion system tube protein TssD [Tepidiformaceae bacterium]